jgi:pimeloyl-ACP methyl ester carboxylesterase
MNAINQLFITMLIASLVLCILLIVCLGAGWYFSNQVIAVRSFTVEETYQCEVDCGKLVPTDWEALTRQEVRVASPFGYELYGIFIPVKSARGTVIITHGITFSLYGSVKYIDLFSNCGWNVLLYDHRAHGRSGGHFKTYGFYEKDDLKAWTDWVSSRGELVAVMGESYGAAVALQAVPLIPNIAFIVADCAFSDLPSLLKYHLQHNYHLPAFPIYHLSNLVTRLRAGFFYEQVNPLKAIATLTTRTPILFTHGEQDVFTPTQMSIDMHNAYPGPKRLYLSPGAGHGLAFWTHPVEYAEQVGEFLQENDFACVCD